MSAGLYTVAQIARYFGKRPQEVAAMIERDGLPCVQLPGEARLVRKVTLHGLHAWLKPRHTGDAFMSVDELASEIAAANMPEQSIAADGVAVLRAAVETVFQSIKSEIERRAA